MKLRYLWPVSLTLLYATARSMNNVVNRSSGAADSLQWPRQVPQGHDPDTTQEHPGGFVLQSAKSQGGGFPVLGKLGTGKNNKLTNSHENVPSSTGNGEDTAQVKTYQDAFGSADTIGAHQSATRYSSLYEDSTHIPHATQSTSGFVSIESDPTQQPHSTAPLQPQQSPKYFTDHLRTGAGSRSRNSQSYWPAFDPGPQSQPQPRKQQQQQEEENQTVFVKSFGSDGFSTIISSHTSSPSNGDGSELTNPIKPLSTVYATTSPVIQYASTARGPGANGPTVHVASMHTDLTSSSGYPLVQAGEATAVSADPKGSSGSTISGPPAKVSEAAAGGSNYGSIRFRAEADSISSAPSTGKVSKSRGTSKTSYRKGFGSFGVPEIGSTIHEGGLASAMGKTSSKSAGSKSSRSKRGSNYAGQSTDASRVAPSSETSLNTGTDAVGDSTASGDNDQGINSGSFSVTGPSVTWPRYLKATPTTPCTVMSPTLYTTTIKSTDKSHRVKWVTRTDIKVVVVTSTPSNYYKNHSFTLVPESLTKAEKSSHTHKAKLNKLSAAARTNCAIPPVTVIWPLLVIAVIM